MENKILTVIVPTYNMERYVAYCLDSLLVKENIGQLEVLIINDGSKDRSLEIACRYEKKYPSVFRVIDKENGNYGSCVNRGVREATGKYVKILDADDSFDTAHFESFLFFLMKTDSDLVLSDFAVVNREREVKKIIRYRFDSGNRFNMNSICNTHIFKKMQMHAVTYRREILLNLGYKQTEGISYTDQEWIFLPMIVVKSVACFNEYVYKYLVGRAGQTVDPEVKRRNMEHIAHCAIDMVTGYECHKNEVTGKNIREYLYERMIPMIKDVYVFSLTHYDDMIRRMLVHFDEQLKEQSIEIYELIGSKEVSSFMGFKYIDYWRRNKEMNQSVIRLMSKIYAMLLTLKQSLQKSDEMSVPASV